MVNPMAEDPHTLKQTLRLFCLGALEGHLVLYPASGTPGTRSTRWLMRRESIARVRSISLFRKRDMQLWWGPSLLNMDLGACTCSEAVQSSFIITTHTELFQEQTLLCLDLHVRLACLRCIMMLLAMGFRRGNTQNRAGDGVSVPLSLNAQYLSRGRNGGAMLASNHGALLCR